MSAKRALEQHNRVQDALDELKAMVLLRYPGATFAVTPAPDEPASVDLLAFVDIEDTEDVLHLVMDRLIDLQVEERLPIHVVALRPA